MRSAFDIPTAPTKLAELVNAGRQHVGEARTASAASGQPVTPEILEAMLKAIPPVCERPDWLIVCGALIQANVTDPNYDTRDLFVRWSSGDLHGDDMRALVRRERDSGPKFKGEDDCIAQWNLDLDRIAHGESVPPLGALIDLAHAHRYRGPTSAQPSTAQLFAHATQGPESAATPPAPVYNWVTSDELTQGDYAEPEHLIEGMLLRGKVLTNNGRPASGKTTLDHQLVISVTAGHETFLGARINAQLPAICVFSEDDAGATKTRHLRLCAAAGVDPATLPIHFLCAPDDAPMLGEVTDEGQFIPGPFWEPFLAKIEEVGECLVVLDITDDVIRLNGNLDLPVNVFLKYVMAPLAHRTGCTFILNRHPSKASLKDGSYSAGSEKWIGSVRNAWTLRKPDGLEHRPTDDRVLHISKMNYGQESELALSLIAGVFSTAGENGRLDGQALQEAVVRVAIHAATLGSPLTTQRRPSDWHFMEVGRDIGRRPTLADMRQALAAALPAGHLHYVQGTSKMAAGYYPAPIELAEDMARAIRAGNGQKALDAYHAAVAAKQVEASDEG